MGNREHIRLRILPERFENPLRDDLDDIVVGAA
jgi:hypothetical protein